jgi:ketosteroid isomerase-like protein
MSKENVEIVRRIFDAWEQQDPVSALSALDPEVEWDLTHHNWPGPQKYYGHEGVAEVLAEWISPFSHYELRAERYIDAGNDKVVAVQVERGTHSDSGVEIDRRTASVYTLRQGKVIRIEHFLDHESALEAAGLRESGS